MIAGDKNKAIGIDMRRPDARDPWKDISVIRKNFSFLLNQRDLDIISINLKLRGKN